MRVLARPKTRVRSTRLAVVGVVAATACVGLVGGPASATVNACGMSQFPAKLFSMSNLKAACTSATSTGGAITIHDFPNAAWHTAAARVVTATLTSGSRNITLTEGTFIPGDAGPGNDINRTVSANGIEAGNDDGTLSPTAFISSISSSTTAVLSKTATASGSVSLKINNSMGRTVYDANFDKGALTVAGKKTLTSATANFTNSDVGEFVYATGIQPGTKIALRTNDTTVVLSQPVTATVSTGTKLQITDYDPTPARVLTDVALNAGSSILTSSSGKFTVADRGLPVFADKVPDGTRVLSVTNATTVVMSANATGTGTAEKVRIGVPTATAPDGGEVVSTITSELNLSPAFIPGFDSCATKTPEGFSIVGIWRNPGSFAETTVPTGSIAQIQYQTGVVTFFAHVIGPKTDSTVTQRHFDIAFAGIPVNLAACPNSPSATTWDFLTRTESQSVSGFGIVRAQRDMSGVGASLSVTGKVTSGASTYPTTCTLNRHIPVAGLPATGPGFTCGSALTGKTG